MKSFDELWAIVKEYRGWLDVLEARSLYRMSSYLGVSPIVELGSYAGKSTSIIAHVVQSYDGKFITVDDFSTEDTREELKRNVERVGGKYELLDMKSDDAVKLFQDESIEMLFIDTVHTYDAVKKDCDLWIPKVKKGFPIFFHDYCSKYEGVKMAVDERLGKDLNMLGVDYSLAHTYKL